jgi:predicted AAA+ superfamily ATPase
MKRDAYERLLSWKTSARRKPLVVRGARQVGKTYLLKEFAKKEYQDFCYLNFEENPTLKDFFNGNLNPQIIIQNLNLYLDKQIKPETSLVIFDEIQECPNALTSLKYFNEQANDIDIIAAGSLLGVKLVRDKGFPVGKINFLDLYPLNFFEFLDAIGKQKLREFLEKLKSFEPLPVPIHEQLISILKYYLVVGGMPEAVKTYIDTNDFYLVRSVHQEILNGYLADFAKHAPANEIMKITTIWESIPGQLAKENKKFIFSALSKSARAREYETALQWLTDAGLIYKSFHVSTPRLPINSYADKNIFKVFLVDVGLLGAMSQLMPKIIVEGDNLFTEFKGALTENYVAQELKAKFDDKLYYWTSEGRSEVDFVVAIDDQILPLEVKAGSRTKHKSLRVYQEKYDLPFVSRATLLNLNQDHDICNYPLYLIAKFPIN